MAVKHVCENLAHGLESSAPKHGGEEVSRGRYSKVGKCGVLMNTHTETCGIKVGLVVLLQVRGAPERCELLRASVGSSR